MGEAIAAAHCAVRRPDLLSYGMEVNFKRIRGSWVGANRGVAFALFSNYTQSSYKSSRRSFSHAALP